MKKIIAVFVVGCLGFLVIPIKVFSAEIGYIEFYKVARKTSAYRDAKKEIEKRKKSRAAIYFKLRQNMKQRVAKAKKDNKSAQEMEKIEFDFYMKTDLAVAEAGEKDKKLWTIKMEFLMKIVKDTAKENGVDVVLEKHAVHFGGIDLTDAVLKKLGKQ